MRLVSLIIVLCLVGCSGYAGNYTKATMQCKESNKEYNLVICGNHEAKEICFFRKDREGISCHTW